MFEQSQNGGDQASEQSSQKAVEQDQVNEQPEGTGEVTQEVPSVELDGEKIPLEEIKKWKEGHMRQEDYTRKTQELAEEKRQLARLKESGQSKSNELDPEVKKAVEVLKAAGMVTKEDLALQKAQEMDQKNFRKILRANPELKAHEKALLAIGKNDNRAWEDIVVDYGFLTKDKLSKAKASKPIVGIKTMPKKEGGKSIADMSPTEYAAWKKENLSGSLR